MALLPWLLALGCATPHPAWRPDLMASSSVSRRNGDDLVVFFALPGREQSDRMERECLPAPEVQAALQRHAFVSARIDGFEQQRMYAEWVGGGEGMGLCVLDAEGRPYAARPGPLDAPEVAAMLDLCAGKRALVLDLRRRHAASRLDSRVCHELGCVLLELGCRVGAEPLLMQAAQGGELDAHHRLARLHALDGHIVRARQWLRTALPSPAADVTLGYVLFKERRYLEAAQTLVGPARDATLGDDALRARLYLGKSLHESGDDVSARDILTRLSHDAKGTTFGAAADHSLSHLDKKDHGHTH